MKIFSKLRRIYRQLAREKPGRRFITYYRKHKKKQREPYQKRWSIIIFGAILVVVGLLISLGPIFPGFLLWIPGLGLLASQIRAVARLLDLCETKFREVSKKFFQCKKKSPEHKVSDKSSHLPPNHKDTTQKSLTDSAKKQDVIRPDAQ